MEEEEREKEKEHTIYSHADSLCCGVERGICPALYFQTGLLICFHPRHFRRGVFPGASEEEAAVVSQVLSGSDGCHGQVK